MTQLSEREYHDTFSEPMARAKPEDSPPFDFWPYFGSIPQSDFGGYDCSQGKVDWVWRDASNTFEHVLINSNDPNVFMVIVLDRLRGGVLGHRLLNLRKEYGLDVPPTGAA